MPLRLNVNTATQHAPTDSINQTIANWTAVNGPVATSSLPTTTDSTNQATLYQYDGDGDVVQMTANAYLADSGAANQVTKYIHGVTTSQGSAVNSNDLLYQVQYPDPTASTASTTQAETYTYNALGQQATFIDRKRRHRPINLGLLRIWFCLGNHDLYVAPILSRGVHQDRCRERLSCG